MSQADPSRHIDASLHGSRPKVQETTSPITELQGADAGAMPSLKRRGGVVEKDADCMKKDPEINVGSSEMGGSRPYPAHYVLPVSYTHLTLPTMDSV